MITNAAVIIALGCALAVSGLPSNFGVDSKYDNSTTGSWDDNLPPSPFTNAQIEEWIKQIEESNVSDMCTTVLCY